MAVSSSQPSKRFSITIGDAASWYCAIVLVSLIMLSSFGDGYNYFSLVDDHDEAGVPVGVGRNQLFMGRPPCDEIYVVGDGETLHTIGDKCGDPFIVENNPHIHDPDDVFPGLVIQITPSKLF